MASGILATWRVMGQSLSVAVAGAVFATLGGAAVGWPLASGRQAPGGAQPVVLQHTFVIGGTPPSRCAPGSRRWVP